MLRYLKFLAAPALLFSSAAFSLGLGEPELRSQVNQPLAVYLPVLNAKDLTLNEIKAKIANNEMFRKHGLERRYIHTNLRVKIETNTNGDMYLNVYTDQVFKEPYIDFLIDLRWTGGKMVREVTLLLDRPN